MTACWCDCLVQDDEDGEYIVRDPSWLKDLETAAAIAKLHDAVQVSTAYDNTGTTDSRFPMTDN